MSATAPTTRIGYRIDGPQAEGLRVHWEVIETSRGSVAIEAYSENGGYPDVETLELDASPAVLRAIAAALVRIADEQQASLDG